MTDRPTPLEVMERGVNQYDVNHYIAEGMRAVLADEAVLGDLERAARHCA